VVVGTSDDAGDPFDGVRFDEDFIRGAATREPTAEDRARRARQEAEEDERIASLRAAHRVQRRSEKRSRRAGRLKVVVVWAVILALVGWYGFDQLAGRGGSDGSGDTTAATPDVPPEWASTEAEAKAVGAGTDRPTPSVAPNTARMSSRPEAPPTEGHFRFLSTQTGSDAPVAYDPCRVIHVVINGRTMPPAAEGFVQDALEEVGHRSGLSFQVEGTTDEPPAPDRPDFQPARYGDRWAPILVAWTDATEDHRLDGDAAGVAGSTFVDAAGRAVYVTGDLSLDGPDVARILAEAGRNGPGYVADIIRHELGHLVGLAHIDDPAELMFPEGRVDRPIGYGPGDRRGLYELGGGSCVPKL
jgi:hypothetical protein